MELREDRPFPANKWHDKNNGVMLKNILESAKLESKFCAELVGVDQEQFSEWVSGVSPIPSFVREELSTILGVPAKTLIGAGPTSGDSGHVAPALWYKLRAANLFSADRELVGMIRKLAFQSSQLQRILCEQTTVYRSYFDSALRDLDRNAPPAVQGQMAADSFRKATGLNRGQSGLGEVLRSFVRASGILLIESPLPKSDVEGSAFNVGLDEQIPSLFANTYKSTWFRRNLVLSHELGHAVFDLQNDPFHADFRDVPCSEMEEIRANAFARELMIPRSVLIHLANSFGLNWAALSEVDLARLVAEAHVELREVLGAAREYGLIDEELEQRYSAASIAQPLRELSPHSLTTDEYLRTLDSKDPVWAAKNRTVWIGGNRLRLPAGYVGRVLKAVESGKVTEGKAAELLLMDRYTFRDRFSSQFLLPEL